MPRNPTQETGLYWDPKRLGIQVQQHSRGNFIQTRSARAPPASDDSAYKRRVRQPRPKNFAAIRIPKALTYTTAAVQIPGSP